MPQEANTYELIRKPLPFSANNKLKYANFSLCECFLVYSIVQTSHNLQRDKSSESRMRVAFIQQFLYLDKALHLYAKLRGD